MPVAVRSGTREVIGGITLDAYVLDDGRRVLSQAGMERALGAGKRSFGRVLARLGKENSALPSVPVFTFRLASGAHANGYEASALVDICQAFQAAFLAGTLHASQEPIARAAMALLAGFAKLGIDAWVDETTGYQKYRDGTELGRRLTAYIRAEMSAWHLTFKPTLVKALCRVYGETYEGGAHPPFLKSVNDKIYRYVLGDEVKDEVKLRNPEPRHGQNHHQLLQDPVKRMLDSELRIVETLARQSSNKDEFWKRMDSHYRGLPFQTGWA
jgi:hypothetical protein